ncbi:MAG: hypothetical protein IKD62_02615 [Oscillospiraceae bacterium]|nr:hypothetical protein [Oscillospiraceae bacterium]
MARDIKTRFVLEGEQKFKSAMKDSANAIKVLNSEEKLAKAQFQQTGDAQKYAAQQAEILKQKIEEQKAAVAAAEEAIRQLSENGVAENSRQMQQWKIKLNDAQTALTRMETDLQNLGAESSEAASETDNLGESLQSLDKKASLEAVLNSVNRLSDGLGTALTKVKDLATGLVSELREAASWADDLATTALVYGMDTETLQRMQFAAQLVDTDVETIIKSRQKLEQAMKAARPNLGSEDFEKQKTSVNEYEKAFAQLGVEIMRYGQYRNWEDVFWEAGDALMHMTDGLDDVAKANAEVVRDTTAQQLFGKSWRELIPLFTAGREGYQEALDSAAVVSEEDVGKLTALDDEIQKLKNQFDTLEKTVFAQLAPALKDLAKALSGVLSEMNEYLQTEEGQAMLQGLSEAVRGLFSDLTNTDFSTVLGTVKDALGKVTEGFAWIKENGGAVTGAVKGIVGAWMALKVTSGMTTVLQLISGMKGLIGLGGGKTPVVTPSVDATPKGTPVSPTGGAAGGAAAASAAETSLMMKIGTSPIGRAVGGLAASGIGDVAGAVVLGVNMLGDYLAAGRTLRDGGSLEEAFNASAEVVKKTFSRENLNDALDNWNPNSENANVIAKGIGAARDWVEDTTSRIETAANEALTSASKGFEDWQRTVEENVSTVKDDWSNLWDEITGHGGGDSDGEGPKVAVEPESIEMPTKEDLEQRMFEEFGTTDPVKLKIMMEANPVKAPGSDGYWSNGSNPVDEMKDSVEQAAPSLNQSMDTIGGNASAGLASGINARAGEAIAAAQALATAVANTIRSALQIASPSKIMMQLGGYVTEGFAEGIESQLGLVNRAAERMADSVNVNPSVGGTSGSRNGGMIDVTLMIGPDQLTEIMTPLVNDSIGEEIALVRR